MTQNFYSVDQNRQISAIFSVYSPFFMTMTPFLGEWGRLYRLAENFIWHLRLILKLTDVEIGLYLILQNS